MIKVKNHLTIIAGLMTAILSSCTKDMSPSLTSSREITLDPATLAHTKAPIAGTTFPSNRTIVLSAYHNGVENPSSNYFQGIPFTKTSTLWTSSGKYWPLEGTLNVLAYSADGLAVTAAYDSNVASGVTLTVPDNSSVQTDILWSGAAAQSYSVSGIPLVFKHAQAALAFTAKSNIAYDAEKNIGITVTGISVKAKYSGKVKLNRDMTCAWSDLSGEKSSSLGGLGTGYVAPTTAIDINSAPFGIGGVGIVVPPQGGTSFTVTYTIHNGRDASGNPVNKQGAVYTHSCSADTWTAGKKYVYNLEFNLDGVTVSSSIYDWTVSQQGTPVAGDVSATYSVSGERNVVLPAATAASNSIIGIDWGDGRTEIINTDYSGNALTLAHQYASAYTGAVKINVRAGSLDFGTVPQNIYNKFNIGEDGRIEIDKIEKKVLSYLKIDGTESTLQNTANCYVVSETGDYVLPCVYGNAIKNSVTNAAAYTNIGGSYCADFVNHLGNVITAPYIEDNAGCTIASANLIWQTSAGLISSVSLEEVDNKSYILFNVANIPATNGIALLSVNDASGNVMWSWMIWLTEDDLSAQTFTNYQGVEYNLMSENLGAIWNTERTMYFNPHFQWGRKDPMAPINGSGSQCTLYDINGSVYSGFGTFGSDCDRSAEKTVANSIRMPNKFFPRYDDTSHNWNNLTRFNNFWNAAKNVDDLADDQETAVKTIYDPCPVGYMLPSGRAFTGFTSTGSNTETPSQFNVIGSFHSGWTFKRSTDDAVGNFFPASGYRYNGSGGLGDLGSYGNYWSFASNSQAHARYLYFYSGGVYPLYHYYRAYGFSVRPCQEFNY